MEIEVSLKVRSAIKAKLLELGVHVDDELPDYIMVLVANRRSKPQMESDLELFLSENTQKFTAWLFHVLKKLEQVTLADSIAVLTGKDKIPESSQPAKSKDKPKEDPEKTKPAKSTDSKVSEKGKSDKPGSKETEKSEAKSGKSGTTKKEKSGTSTGASQKTTKKVSEVKGDKKKVEKPVKPSTSTAPKSSDKSSDSKVQFKLKNNLVKQTEFDRKQAEVEDRKAEKSGTNDGTNLPKGVISSAEEQNRDPILHDDILNLGDDEDGDLFEVGEEQGKTKTKAVSETKAATDDDEDVEKLRKIALETKSPNRRKLATGNVTALRGMVMNFEKENSNKRKRQSDESTESKKSISRSNSRSDVPKEKDSTRAESPPKKLRSVVTVTAPKKPFAEEYDPEQPKIHKLSSVVCVTTNQRPKRDTTSMNTNLIFKAMKEVEIDNIKRPMKAHEEEGKRRRGSDDRDRERGWRIARSPRRSRSRSRGRRDVSKDRVDRDYSHHRRDRRDSSSGRSSHRRRDDRSRSRSPLQLFTRRGRMTMKERLGEKQLSHDPEALEVQRDLLDDTYERELREMEKDINIIVNVPNVRNESDGHVKESERSVSSGDKEKSPIGSPVESSNNKAEKGYKAPNRISIQVMNSDSEDESEASDNERSADRGKNSNQEEEESEAELEVTINQDHDIDDLLPPQQQNEENSQEKKVTTDEKPTDRLTDLRAKLAAITRSSTASYSPLQIQQPSRPQPPTVVQVQPATYFTPYYYDSLPAMSVTPVIPATNYSVPTTTCKFWPTCSYGENCKYTHPKCKFGYVCAKKPNCPFKHDTDAFSSTPAYTPVPTFTKQPTKYTTPIAPNKKLCHFFPKCHTMDCVYYHPKPCRYGVNCVDSACTHYHPGAGSIGERKGGKLPALHQLKWSRSKTDGGHEQQATTT